MSNDRQNQLDQSSGQDSSNDGMLGGISNKLSSTMGAGQGNGEDQSYLSQGINAVQQSVFGQNNQTKSGSENPEMDQKKQDVHAAVDQAHPEKISEYMRDKYMSRTDEMDKEEGRS